MAEIARLGTKSGGTRLLQLASLAAAADAVAVGGATDDEGGDVGGGARDADAGSAGEGLAGEGDAAGAEDTPGADDAGAAALYALGEASAADTEQLQPWQLLAAAAPTQHLPLQQLATLLEAVPRHPPGSLRGTGGPMSRPVPEKCVPGAAQAVDGAVKEEEGVEGAAADKGPAGLDGDLEAEAPAGPSAAAAATAPTPRTISRGAARRAPPMTGNMGPGALETIAQALLHPEAAEPGMAAFAAALINGASGLANGSGAANDDDAGAAEAANGGGRAHRGSKAVAVAAAPAGPPAPADADDASQAARLVALNLMDISPTAMEDEGAFARAATLAFSEVERAAEALSLPTALFDSVCTAVEGALRDKSECHMFVGMSYRRLRRVCQAGDLAAAKGWMENMGGRGGGGGGGSASG
jgi:hypothetical protein